MLGLVFLLSESEELIEALPAHVVVLGAERIGFALNSAFRFPIQVVVAHRAFFDVPGRTRQRGDRTTRGMDFLFHDLSP
jgi:hypothetical protein